MKSVLFINFLPSKLYERVIIGCGFFAIMSLWQYDYPFFIAIVGSFSVLMYSFWCLRVNRLDLTVKQLSYREGTWYLVMASWQIKQYAVVRHVLDMGLFVGLEFSSPSEKKFYTLVFLDQWSSKERQSFYRIQA